MSKLDKLMQKRNELKLRIQEERQRDAIRRQRNFMRRARAAGLLALSEEEMEGAFERLTADGTDKNATTADGNGSE